MARSFAVSLREIAAQDDILTAEPAFRPRF
jgi:hypothetical protein